MVFCEVIPFITYAATVWTLYTVNFIVNKLAIHKINICSYCPVYYIKYSN